MYLAISLRIIFCWLPTSVVMKPARFVWRNSLYRVYEIIPPRLHQPLAALVTVATILVGSLVPGESGDNTRANRGVSIFGLVVLIGVLYASSRDRKKIRWHTVIGGMLAQFIIAVFVLKTTAGYDIFSFISNLAEIFLGFSNNGLTFLTDDKVKDIGWFMTGTMPPIIFFVSVVSLLYHWGILQWVVRHVAIFFFWMLRVSGAEAVVAAATPFVGQGESAMLIKPFIPYLTLGEIHQVMTCGFATVSGSMLAAYISLGVNPQALITSCVMSIPASLAVSKMRYPETEETLTSGNVNVPEDEQKAANAIQAFASGAWLGLKIAVSIVATILCVISLIALVDGFLTWWGRYWSISDPYLTLDLILGYLLYPVAWLLGVPKQDLRPFGQVVGLKIIANEFVAFQKLSEEPYKSMTSRGKLIATYACCVSGSLAAPLGVLYVTNIPSRALGISARSESRSQSCRR